MSFRNLVVIAAGGCALAFLPAVALAQTADYAMHEWGLVSFLTPEVEFLSSGHEMRVPATQEMPIEIRGTAKPVIYLTPGATFEATTVVSLIGDA